MISDFVKGLFWSFGNQQEFLFGKYVQEIVLKRVEKGKFLSERVCSYMRLLTNEKQHSDQDLPIGSKANFICFR